jgi:hypothetical protein
LRQGLVLTSLEFSESAPLPSPPSSEIHALALLMIIEATSYIYICVFISTQL